MHRIRLTKTKSYRDVVVGGLKRATDMFGPEIVHMDDESDPPALIVKGDTTILRKVQKCLNGDKLPEGKIAECSICWQRSEDIIRLSACNHVTCQDCFVEYCMVDIDVKFPLRCFQSECDKLIGMDQIRSSLESHQMQRLLSESLAGYLRRNPEEYSPCIGADCAASYRISVAREQHICPECFTVICAKCKVEFHFGETCDEYQLRTSGHLRALEQWIEAEGAKHCRRCNAVVQKLEGCDNMTCHFCKADFCWKCMEIFPTHQEVYQHLIRKHGGYFGDEQEQMENMREMMEEDDIARVIEHAMQVDEDQQDRRRRIRDRPWQAGPWPHLRARNRAVPRSFQELDAAEDDELEAMIVAMERQFVDDQQALDAERDFLHGPVQRIGRDFRIRLPRHRLELPVNIPLRPPPAAPDVNENGNVVGWRAHLDELRERRAEADRAA